MRTTRLAPSPTGALHLGNARTFLANWLLARRRGWRVILRVEDIDGPRIKAGAARGLIEDLQWLGLDWDEGPIYQSDRRPFYDEALQKLIKDGKAYPCVCSRKEVDAAASAPHAEDGAAVYPGTCRGRYASVAAARDAGGRAPAIRFAVPDEKVEFVDGFAGARAFDVARELGDFVVAKSDGTPAYQLAVVVDDAAIGVTDVVRGDDLLDSTPRQMLLYRALGLAEKVPTYYHVPLVVGADGRRLAKRHGDTRLASYRALGVTPQRVVALLARWCGVDDAGDAASRRTGGSIRSSRHTEVADHVVRIRRRVAEEFDKRTHDNDGDGLSPTFEHYARRVMSGAERGPRAAALRVAMSAARFPYALASGIRNRLFDAGLRKPARLLRPVISVGNLTTGGTGKTPVVRWLAERLRHDGMTVAVLARGYKSKPGELGDEQRMLADLLNRPGESPVIVRADPNRLRAGGEVLRQHPGVGVFVLDDGFQHRQLARDFDLVVINAAEPFGFGHVLPRGMLREPLPGALRRANAFVLTRSDHVDEPARARVVETVRRHNAAAPIYPTVHAPTGFRDSGRGDLMPFDSLRGRQWFAFCGIGGPESFVRQLQTLGGTCAGHHAFADHHEYTHKDLADLAREAAAAGADLLVTTEKDWVKIAAFLPSDGCSLPIWRLDVEIRFVNEGDQARLLADVKPAVESAGKR